MNLVYAFVLCWQSTTGLASKLGCTQVRKTVVIDSNNCIHVNTTNSGGRLKFETLARKLILFFFVCVQYSAHLHQVFISDL